MRFLKYLGALLAAEIPVSLAVAQLEDHDGLVGGHIPAANGVLLYHDDACVLQVFIECPLLWVSQM